ncbi:NADPH-dependent oxidoreductase [Solimonas sp. K1W22B-7]|uniref:NADPH-dependent FMN reductase n=1 Tax=Solimonas sp. K1W22B-7 TaxID=2303331 RepID=UPI000E3372F3|nr:NAD(P)H-dependent oxidoreductase [Solimonas sp. K1W22B-7]AXQ28144.1 NADPH-dependent oxidoreductase [Solimonas sp. K1W22B-7]
MDDRIRLGLIYGSTRKGRLCDTVANWVTAQVREHPGFELEAIDPLRLPHDADGRLDADHLEACITRNDAFIVVTPEYNHGYPAPLKELLDAAYEPWQAKPVAFVSYGGVSGGLRAVEQLRQVFAELDAVGLRETVSFTEIWEQFSAAGELRSPDRARRSMGKLLTRLQWWAASLRDARRKRPLQQAA